MEKPLQELINEFGKGSDPRPMEISKDEFEKNFEKIFGKKKNKTDDKSEEKKYG
tara:strand:+ start:468 stop:629 length:162 start_codon:yes stop_codon:yes gene_type:complete